MKNRNRLAIYFTLFSLLASLLGACGGNPAPQSADNMAGNIAISGAFALYPMMTRWAEEFQKVHPQVTFDISAGGAGKGMADALSGAVDIGMVSRAITAEEEGKGAFWVPVTKDAVFATVNAQNPALDDLLKKGLTRQQFIAIFIDGTVKSWGELVDRPEVTEAIHVYTRSDACGAAETWAKYLGDKKQEDLLGVAVFGDPGLLDAVVKDPLGIGFNNLGYAYDLKSGKPVEGTLTVPIDDNENGQADPDEVLETMPEAIQMVATGKYPSPPARALNLVTKGKPSGVMLAFLQWILTDGQKYVGEGGYIQLPQDQLQAALGKLQ
jgi:phosphate transport system substrate-binding protein